MKRSANFLNIASIHANCQNLGGTLNDAMKIAEVSDRAAVNLFSKT